MRAEWLLTLVLFLPAAGARAGEDLLAAETIQAREVQGRLSSDPSAPFWDDIGAREVPVASQRSVRLHDRKANEGLTTAGPRTVSVRAAVDGKDLAVLLEWSDRTEDRVGRVQGQPDEAAPAPQGAPTNERGFAASTGLERAGAQGAQRPSANDGRSDRAPQQDDGTDVHGDAAALQLPLRFGAGLRLPYVGMGDDDMKVAIHLQRAAADGTVARAAVAAGFGSLTRADLGGASVAMRHDAARGTWRAVFVRPLAAAGLDLRRGLVPFAVAVWDGARSERGGNKALSGWRFLRMPGFPVDEPYVAELAWGRRPGQLGDPVRGKQLVQGMCAACHVIGERRAARPGLAPELTGIGAIATPAYLRESIVDPGAVIVPSPNAAQHQDRAKAPGVVGAFPASDAFVWFRRDAAGKKVSKMPPYAGLPQADVLAMVAYLATLGAPESGAGGTP